MRTETALHDGVETDKRTTTDKQNIRGVDLDVFLVGVLAASLGRYVARRALEDFQQRLLHAFTGNIAGDGNIFSFATNLVDLVDINDPALGFLHIIIRRLEQ